MADSIMIDTAYDGNLYQLACLVKDPRESVMVVRSDVNNGRYSMRGHD